MRTLFAVTLLISLWLVPSSAISQQSDAQRRAQEIAASFNKQKRKVKEKFGFREEKYKEVRSEPVIRRNIRDYSGVYEVPDLGYTMNLQVGSDGTVEASGFEPATGGTRQARRFRLENGKAEGALLTGTKVYEDGATEKFEGVFMNRTVFSSPTDKGVSVFGLGVVGNPVEFAGVTFDKLFYELK
jgi:hypothetical protein